MQIKNRVFAVLLVIVLTGANLAMFKILDFLDNGKPDLNVPVPTEVNWKIRFNLKTFLKKEIYTLLFQEKNDDFLDQFREQIRKRMERNSTKGSLHIDLEQDLIVYALDLNDANFQAILFQTTNPKKFNAHISEYCSKNQSGYALGNNALHITQRSGKKLSQPELLAVVRKLLHAPKTTFKYDEKNEAELLEVHVNAIHQNVRFKKMNLHISEFGQELTINGSISYPTDLGSAMKFGLKSTGVSIYSRFIPKDLPDTLLYFLPDNMPHFKDIQAFAIDYQGLNLEDPVENMPISVGHFLVPKMNLIIQTKNSINISELWNEFPENVRLDRNRLKLGKVIYELKQLNQNTYFIGVDANAVIPKTSTHEIFVVEGSLLHSTKVYGGTFITKIIENMGPMLAINNFFKATELFKINVVPNHGNNYTIQGTIRFKKDKYPLNEITKLVANSPFSKL